MAVTLDPSSLEQPMGELDNSYFPQGDLSSLLEGWLLDATARVEGDSNIASANHNTAAAAWVYYRAYSHIANGIRSLPSSVAEGDGAIEVAWLISQSRDWADKAAGKLAEYNAVRSANSSISSLFTLATGRRGL